jgi:hypothetical protein
MVAFTKLSRSLVASFVLGGLASIGCSRSPANLGGRREPIDSTSAEFAVSALSIPASAASTPAPCGLPASLVARGWPRELTPTSATRSEPVAPSSKTAFTLGVIPDTQYYTLCRNLHFTKQAQWLASRAAASSLSAVIHLGDITESNTPEEWVFAQAALAPLLAKVPTFLATGNHDYGDGGTANRRFTLFANYFSTPPPPTRRTVAEALEPTSLENAYYRVPVEGGGGGRAMLGVLVLGWSPQAAAVAWANSVLAKYPNDRVVFVTHAYLYYDSTRYDWATKGKEQEWNPHAYGEPRLADKQAADVFDGEKLWHSLIAKHDNVFLTLNGHVLGDGTGLLTSRTPRGGIVHQMLANYQALNEGGLGYLRLLEFDANGRTLRVRTYSPSLDIWATAPDQQFDLDVTPPLW